MNSTILLVDDLQMFLEIEKDFFQQSPVQILTAKNGIEALQTIKFRQPDLIFMDFQMPQMDGAACCRAIKADPVLFTTPVVMITASGNEEDREICESAGCDSFLTKPLDRDKFLEAGRKYIPKIDRREQRLEYAIEATLHVKKADLPCSILNLSAGGAYIVTDCSIMPEEVIQVAFSLPDGTVVECHGRIAWVNRMASRYPPGFGVKFALISKSAKEAIKKLVGVAGVCRS